MQENNYECEQMQGDQINKIKVRDLGHITKFI